MPKANAAMARENIQTVFGGGVIIKDTENTDQIVDNPIRAILFIFLWLINIPMSFIIPKNMNTKLIA